MSSNKAKHQREDRTALENIMAMMDQVESAFDVSLESDYSPVYVSPDSVAELWIRNDRHKVVPFEPNRIQLEVLNDMNQQMREEGNVRQIWLKCRQWGGSTIACAYCYCFTRDHGIKSTIVGHKKPASTNLYKKIELMYKKDPLRVPASDTYNRMNLIMDNGGEFYVGTAGSADFATSQTNQFLLFTEMALWANQLQQMRSLMMTVNAVRNTVVIIESTARESGSEYHKIWQGATALPGSDERNEYHPRFVGWNMVDWKDVLPFNSFAAKKAFEKKLNDDELAMQAKFNLSLEQLNWRRHTLKNKCGGDVGIFQQEHPITAEEAFLTAGRPKFDNQILDEMMRLAPAPLWRGEIIDNSSAAWEEVAKGGAEGKKVFDEATFPSAMGRFEIFSFPEEYVDYIVGADIAEGMDSEKGEGDTSVAQVVRDDTGEQVAVWQGRIHPENFADVLTDIGFLYNNAFMSVEVNNMGLTTMGILRKQYPNDRIYQEIDEDNQPLVITGKATPRRYGIYTSDNQTRSGIKTQMLNVVAARLRNKLLYLKHRPTIAEMKTIVGDGRGGFKTNGKDLTMAMACCLFGGRQSFPVNKRPDAVSLDVLIARERRKELHIARMNEIARDAWAQRMGVA